MLRWFVSLCETENMRDTAALERINQSTLSRSLARLEEEVGAELFHRRGRRLVVNRLGVLYREHAVRALDELDLARRRVQAQINPETGVIRLGFLHSVGRWLVPEVLRDHRAHTPGIHFELHMGFARELRAWLEADEVDVALVTPPPEGAALSWYGMREQRLCIALPPGHPLAGVPGLRLADVRDEPFVAFAPTTDLRQVIDRLCHRAGFQPVIAFESEEIATVRGLIGAGLGVGVLPRPAVLEHDDPVYLPLVPAQHRPIGLAWKEPVPAPAARFIDHIRGRAAQ
ncbi:LysR substrate-binding domain-containing protein [Nonomuraea sp. NBC_01738]|uniref:LysR substrate-binding domain-containing protein n=1 Tax=Nonomuraea sp. NBC_01738 TaxID=2976003 RepID=UPI002E11A0DE|nr:LysR substrate-binding domain-containing protein [Nonomuraea sp. NBC_01738]